MHNKQHVQIPARDRHLLSAILLKPDQKKYVVAHSMGGQLVGLKDNHNGLERCRIYNGDDHAYRCRRQETRSLRFYSAQEQRQVMVEAHRNPRWVD